MATKKRKLPKDLKEASQMATALIATSNRVDQACVLLSNMSFQDLQGISTQLTSEHLALCLIAKLGLRQVATLTTTLSSLPESLPPFDRAKYLREITNMPEADSLCSFIQAHCPQLCQVFPQSTLLLAPPVSTCFQCQRQLTSNHSCKVSQ